MHRLIDGYLRSPMSGIAPWILMSVLSSPGRFEEAVSFALGLALLTMWLGTRHGIRIHALDVFGVLFFAAMAVVGAFAEPDVISWMELWAGELTNAALALFVLATIVIRHPFTLPYAKEQTPPEFWGSPLFKRVNYRISWVWAGAFAFCAAVGLVGDAVLHNPDGFWTGWVLQLAAIFFAINYTEFHPEHAGARDALARGEQARVPSVLRLLDWVPTFVLVCGIFALVTDADVSGTVAWGMVAFGSVGSAILGRLGKRGDAAAAPTSTRAGGALG